MTLAAPPITAYRPFAAEVARVQRLSPSFLRVTFTGPSFGDLAPNGFDQRIKVLLPTAAGGLRDCPHGDDWYAEWRALPEDRRNPMRTYTVRAARPEQREIDVDFVLHGSTGPASAWAETAAAGDEVVLVGPNARFEGPTGGFEWHPPTGAPCLLLAGDETAVPAVCAIVESLPAGSTARVFMEVPDAGDILPLAVPVVTTLLGQGEPIRTEAWAGMVLIVAGVFLRLFRLFGQGSDSGCGQLCASVLRDAHGISIAAAWRSR